MPKLLGQQIVVPSGSYTTTQTSPIIENFGCKGVRTCLNIPSSPGSGTVTVSINEIDANGNSNTLLSSAALSTAGNYYLTVYPSITAVANSIAQNAVGQAVQIVAASNGTSLKFAVGLTFLA
jgi:hypothetical protein